MRTITVQRNIPYLLQYFGAWAIHEPVGEAVAQFVSQVDFAAHMAAVQAKGSPLDVLTYMAGEVAVVELNGLLMKSASSIYDSTSTLAARRALRHYANEDSARSIVVKIESPGGTSAGVIELADEIAAAAKRKTVIAFIEDLGASAAYWAASQASAIFANAAALVGSIGVYSVVEDSSNAAERAGIKIHVIRTGEYKGAGVRGSEVTSEQLTEVQRVVDGVNDLFLAHVARGRSMSLAAVKAIADGRVHLAAEAKRLGLIDDVRSLESTLVMLNGIHAQRVSKPTTEAKSPPVIERAAKVRVEPGSRHPLSAADRRFIESLKPSTTENRVMSTTPAKRQFSDPIAQFQEAVQAEVENGKTKETAHMHVCRKQPDLREAYVAAYNERHRANR